MYKVKITKYPTIPDEIILQRQLRQRAAPNEVEILKNASITSMIEVQNRSLDSTNSVPRPQPPQQSSGFKQLEINDSFADFNDPIPAFSIESVTFVKTWINSARQTNFE